MCFIYGCECVKHHSKSLLMLLKLIIKNALNKITKKELITYLYLFFVYILASFVLFFYYWTTIPCRFPILNLIYEHFLQHINMLFFIHELHYPCPYPSVYIAILNCFNYFKNFCFSFVLIFIFNNSFKQSHDCFFYLWLCFSELFVAVVC